MYCCMEKGALKIPIIIKILLCIILLIAGKNEMLFSQADQMGNFGEIQQWEPPPAQGKWFQLQSGHFVIWYEEYYEDIAFELVSYAEDFYKDYSDVFNYNLKKVYIKIHGRGNISNGFYNPAPATITFYPTSAMLDTKGFNWNYFLLAHEFLHYIHLEYDRGIAAIVAKIIGPSGRLLVMGTPLWALEGLAVAVESDYTSSGRAQHPLFTMPVRANILLNNRETYLESTRYFLEDEGADYGRRYSYGTALMEYIKTQYGYQTIAEIWQYFMKFPLNYSSRHKKFVGKTLYELHEEMINSLETRYAKYSSWPRGKELLDKDRTRAEYTILNTSDKGVLLYKTGTDVRNQFMLYSTKDNTVKNLFSASYSKLGIFSEGNAAISRDGNFVVYQKSIRDASQQSLETLFAGTFNEVFLYNVAKKKHTRLTKRQNLSRPIISPDNKSIYVSQFTHGGTYTRLIRFSTENPKNGFEVIYEGEESVIVSKTISPDGNKIAFVERSHIDGIQLRVLNLQTKEISNIIQADYWLFLTSVNFVDNGTLSVVADIEDTGENTQLYSINIQDKIWTRIARDKIGFIGAIISQGKVIYSSHNSFAHSIYVYQAEELLHYSSPQIVDFSRINKPIYNENDLQRNINEEAIANPEQVDSRTGSLQVVSTATTILQTKLATNRNNRRIWGVIPARLVYVLPFYSLDNNFQRVGAITEWRGKNDLSLFNLGVFWQIENFNVDTSQVIFDVSYRYIFMSIGEFRLNGLRNHAKNRGVNYTTNGYSLNYLRGLVTSNNGHSLSIDIGGIYLQETYDVSTLTELEKKINNIDAENQSLSFKIQFPFKWSEGKRTLVSKQLSLSIDLGLLYTPPLLSIKKEIQGTLEASTQVPLGRLVTINMSMYNVFSDLKNTYLKTERYSRYVVTFPFAQTGNLSGGKGSLNTQIQSSFALDVLFSLGNFKNNGGSYIMDMYTGYTNFFIEQTVGYDIQKEQFDLNKYLIAGNESGLVIAFYSVPVSIKLGGAFKIPYNRDADFGYMFYISFGPSAYTTAGTRASSGSREKGILH